MNKKRIIAVAGVACVAGLYFVIPDSEPEYVAPVQKEAPQGYQYNRSNNLIPIVEAKTLANKRSFFNDMRLDAKKGLDKTVILSSGYCRVSASNTGTIIATSPIAENRMHRICGVFGEGITYFLFCPRSTGLSSSSLYIFICL